MENPTPPATEPAATLASVVAAPPPQAQVEPATPAEPVYITIDDVIKVDLRVATITTAENHPKADRLLKLQLDVGPLGTRQICAGIRSHYTPESLVGRQIIIVANLAPRALRGETSSGMLLAASLENGETRELTLLAPSSAIAAGAKVG